MKKLLKILRKPPTHWVGNGFHVHSVFDYNGAGQELSPFLLMDYGAPHTFEAGTERRGVGAHPHKGFETVTFVFQGELEHRDSTGAGGMIGPGDVQWMTAGRGIVHEEFHSPRFTESGGTLEMVQLWVNLRAADKNAPPQYQSLAAKDIPTVGFASGNGFARVIAGTLQGQTGPAHTFSPIDLWDITTTASGPVTLPVKSGYTSAILVLREEISFADQQKASPGDLVVFSTEGDSLEWTAGKGAQVLLLAGAPFDEPIVGHGPFVMNTRQEILEAFAEFESGAFGST